MFHRNCGREYCRRAIGRLVVRLLVVAGLVLAWCMYPVKLHAQDKENDLLSIVSQKWGFDGRVQPGQFNPVSILVDNRSEEAIDVVASLTESKGTFLDSSGEYLQPVYIAPGGRRWIQFYPYISSFYQSEWKLKLGKKTFGPLQRPRSVIDPSDKDSLQLPQAVIFDVPDSLSRQPGSVKHFPENIFPPYSTATFGLHTVFMDHVPDWEQPRQQAFMSWVRQGGRLHLLKDRRGEYPEFSGELSELSQPFESFRVGRGQIVRHSIQRIDLTDDIVKTSLRSTDISSEQQELDKAIENTQENQLDDSYSLSPDMTDEEIFRNMRQMTQPRHSWGLIFFLALCYIGMIFPGCWIVSQRKQVHYLVTYGAIAGLSIVFSLLFLLIGRRGYGESTTVHTLAIARMEEGGVANVFQWNALFVTSGNTYTASGTDQQTVFSTATADQNVNAGMTAGNAGELVMRIPPFSTQVFVARRQMQLPNSGFRIRNVTYNRNRLSGLEIQTDAGFQPDPDAVFRLIAGDDVYRLQFDETSSTIKLIGAVSRLDQFCRNQLQSRFFAGGFGNYRQSDNRTDEQRFYDDVLPDAVRHSLYDDLNYKPEEFELPADRVRLLIYSPIEEHMQLQLDTTARQTGRVLYVHDLFLDTDTSADQQNE